MNRSRNFSSPDIYRQSVSTPSSPTNLDRHEELSLDGCTTTLKLLIKLIQDHNELCNRENEDRRMNRVTGMINILEEVMARLHKSQSSFGNTRVAELRRCNSDLRPRRSNNERKSLEIMCSSLGKEKEIMATELSKKVHELNEMEEHINDLKIQNEMLLARLQSRSNNGNDNDKRETQHGNAELLERNKLLSEQLLKALDGFRALKRRLKESQDDKATMQSAMGELGKEVSAGLDRVRGLKHTLNKREAQPVDIEGEISALQHVFESLESRFSRSTGQKQSTM